MSQSLFENYETCSYGECFLPWPGFQPSERVVMRATKTISPPCIQFHKHSRQPSICDLVPLKPLTISGGFVPDNRCHGGTQARQRERLRQARTVLGFQEMTHRFIDHVTGDEDHAAA